jgi:anti-anti-sigma regulatory factor
MTLKIDAVSDGPMTTLRLSGRIDFEHLEELEAQLRRHGPRVAIDFDDVTLVDLAAVRFLIAREADGVELRNCAPYIREWMHRERNRT